MTWRAQPHWLDPQLQKLVLNDPHFTILRLTSNREIEDKDIEKLAQALDGNTKLRELNLRGCNITSRPISLVASVLANRTGLQTLNLSMNIAGDPGAQYLAEALRINGTLKELHLALNAIGENGSAAIGLAMKSNRSIVHLNLGGNSIGTGARFFAEVLEHDTPLEELILSNCGMEADELGRLASALVANHILKKLDLNSNKIGDDGAEKFATSLARNHSLQDLDLGQGIVGNRGATFLARSLAGNSGITHLRLGCNMVGSEGAEVFSETVLKFNTTIREISLNCNPVGAGALGHLEDVLDRNIAQHEGRAPRVQDLVNDPRREKSRELHQETTEQPEAEAAETEVRSYIKKHVRDTFSGSTNYEADDVDQQKREKSKGNDKLVSEILQDLGIDAEGGNVKAQEAQTPTTPQQEPGQTPQNGQDSTVSSSVQDGEPANRESLISDILADLGSSRPVRDAKPRRGVKKRG